MRKLRCFIASAFGHSDVDEIYEQGIIPALKNLDITPVRVDRINHNEKIDQKIIELIQESDFGVADLTFARPSVYYEAGLLEGLNKGVIYISRHDHLSSIEDDIYGNFKIHFDLITKNIIVWTRPNKTFHKSLSSRIRLVTKPIIIRLKQEGLERDVKLEFDQLSMKERLESIRSTINTYLIGQKFANAGKRHSNYVNLQERLELELYVEDSINKSDLSVYRWKDEHDHYQGKLIRLFVSLIAIPKSRIETALPSFRKSGNKVYTYDNYKYIFLDSIDSQITLKKRLESLEIKKPW